MEITKAIFERQKGKTIFDIQFGYTNHNVSNTITHRALSDLFVRIAELELHSRLTRTELGVTEFRAVTPTDNQGIKQNHFNMVKAFQEQLESFVADVQNIRAETESLKGTQELLSSNKADPIAKFRNDKGFQLLIEKYGSIMNSTKECFENWELLTKGELNELALVADKKKSNWDHNWDANYETQIHNHDNSGREHYLDEEFHVEVFEIGDDVPIPPFRGEGDISFTEWLIRFQDLADAQNNPWADELKLSKLKFMLEGSAREKFEQLTVAEKGNYDLAVNKLTSLFENTMSRNVARQGLRNCKQIKGEAVRAFMTRLKRLVIAATVGQGNQMFQQVLLDEFMDRLEPTLGFHVKISQPATVEEAVNKALHIEHLIEAQTVAKQKEIEEIAGMVRATILNSQISNSDETVLAVHQELQASARTFGYGDFSQNRGSHTFDNRRVDPDINEGHLSWSSAHNSNGRSPPVWNEGGQNNLVNYEVHNFSRNQGQGNAYGFTQGSANSFGCNQGSSSFTPIVSNHPTGSFGTFEHDLQRISGQVDTNELAREMAEKLVLEGQENDTFRHMYPN
ncbi:CBR-DCT-10 protein [Ditylenchus destructor]|uniref:CBR-DCT-10 protein n=1 Tax=Ditylenchus destructor TaxID=166010 RepID=A0AAD4R558_9BILA|nr:CBR-DCT-10 protein [Ditylenchus destructor]